MYRAYKYRIYPTEDQKHKIDCSIGVCRLIYNLALEIKINAFKEHGRLISAIDLGHQLPELRKEYPWIEEVDSQAQWAAIKNMDNAFKNFFKGIGGYPKFKKKSNTNSFQCPNNTRRIDFDLKLLTIPKIKDIPIRISRKFEGKIKVITISKTATGKYFASILVDNGVAVPKKVPIVPETTLGIDVGIKDLVICSDGRKYSSPKALKNNLQRLKVLQRRASRKKKGSNNRKKANLCVSILHERIKNIRLDNLHKITSHLMNDNQVQSVVIENLNVSGLSKNRKLSKEFKDASFSELFRQLKYKAEWLGKNAIVIDRFAPSSKTCSNCGHINQELTLGHREWECQECKMVHDRDLNASINIKNFGLNNSGRGTSGEPGGVAFNRRGCETGRLLMPKLK